MDISQWQQMECARLGLTVEQHNEIIAACVRVQAAGCGNPYDFIVLEIGKKRLAELAKSLDIKESQ